MRFIEEAINNFLEISKEDVNQLRKMIITPNYAYIRHLLCGPRSAARWTRQRGTGLHSFFPYAHMNKEARMWGRIVYHCLIQGKHMIEVTRDRVC